MSLAYYLMELVFFGRRPATHTHHRTAFVGVARCRPVCECVLAMVTTPPPTNNRIHTYEHRRDYMHLIKRTLLSLPCFDKIQFMRFSELFEFDWLANVVRSAQYT